MRSTLLLLASLGLVAACTPDYDGDGDDFEVDCNDQEASMIGVHVYSTASFTSDTCDFGTPGGGDDNTIDVFCGVGSYTVGDDESFTCSGVSCVW